MIGSNVYYFFKINHCKLPELEEDVSLSRQNSRMSSTLSGKLSRSSKSHIQSTLADVPLDKVRASANAIWNCCKSQRNRKLVISSEIPPYLIRLLERTADEDIHVPVIGIIRSCSTDVSICFINCLIFLYGIQKKPDPMTLRFL